MNWQRVEMEEVFDSAKERLDGGTTPAITAFANRGGQIGRAVTTVLGGDFANRLGKGSQNLNTALGALCNQITIVVTGVQQQSGLAPIQWRENRETE